MQYDFTSFVRPVTEAERKDFKARDHGNDGTDQYWIVVVVISVFAGIFSLAMVGSLLSSLGMSAEGVLAGGFVSWVGLTALAIYGLRWLGRVRQAKLVKLDRFARTNRMEFLHDRVNPNYDGMVFDEGHSRVLNEALLMNDGTEIGNYTYVTGSGKNRTVHTYAFVSVPLERALPHMVLDAKSNNLFGKFSNLPDTFDGNQTLSLEGDFDNYFTLYAPRQYERDALYVFTPDVMAALIDSGSSYDMEAIDKRLYIYRSGHFNLMNEGEMRSLFAIIGMISSELRAQTKRYADERVGDSTMNIIAPQGARLKHGVNWLVVGVLVLFFGYQFAESFLLQQGNWSIYLLGPFIISAIITTAIVLYKKRSS